MSKSDLVQADGEVTSVTGGGEYSIRLDAGHAVMARIGGKMRKFKIRILVGDRVTVALSPYDLSHGLIVHRHRNQMGGAP